jgi:hypothetical protein
MGAACPCPIEAVFSAIAEAALGLFTAEIIERSSGTFVVTEAPATEAGRIRLKTRTIDSRTGRSIFLFFIATSDYPSSEN